MHFTDADPHPQITDRSFTTTLVMMIDSTRLDSTDFLDADEPRKKKRRLTTLFLS